MTVKVRLVAVSKYVFVSPACVLVMLSVARSPVLATKIFVPVTSVSDVVAVSSSLVAPPAPSAPLVVLSVTDVPEIVVALLPSSEIVPPAVITTLPEDVIAFSVRALSSLSRRLPAEAVAASEFAARSTGAATAMTVPLDSEVNDWVPILVAAVSVITPVVEMSVVALLVASKIPPVSAVSVRSPPASEMPDPTTYMSPVWPM